MKLFVRRTGVYSNVERLRDARAVGIQTDDGAEFELHENNHGEIVLRCIDGRLSIQPDAANGVFVSSINHGPPMYRLDPEPTERQTRDAAAKAVRDIRELIGTHHFRHARTIKDRVAMADEIRDLLDAVDRVT